MDHYRVPTMELEAEVVWADGQTLTGTIFMPEQSAIQVGRMKPAEWINRRLTFFPLGRQAGGSSILVNKGRLLAIGIAVDAAEQEARVDRIDVPVRHVVIETGPRAFEGRVVIDMPVNQQRLADYLNRDETFVLLHGPDRDYLIHKVFVTSVRELEEME